MHQGGRPDVSGTAGPSAPAGYRLIHLLGRGGMGEVYLAEDLRLNRKVAIKFLLAHKSKDDDARRRLLREAQAAAALDHPCICAVYETGDTPDGHAYIVMQYVDGEPLSAILQRGPLPARQALELCGHIAEALSAAHQQGIIHRDLKPANVIVMKSGRPKILDLGIAKVIPGMTPSGDTEEDTGSTAAGDLIGTAGYMSPEQVQHRRLDGRCDLFSLGALLFECLTGRRAFDGSTTFETLANVLHVHPPAPSQLRPELTEAHDELCRRLLAKDPADRFQSADEVVGAIRALALDPSRTTGHPQVAESLVKARQPSFWSRRATVLGGIALIAIAVTAWLWMRPRGLPPPPPDAARWYERGADAIREGAYQTGLRALDESLRQFPQLVLAYARRAEAYAELDDQEAAKDQLIEVARLVPNESRLPPVERLRIQALRALVVRDVDSAVSLYRELVNLVSDEARAWLDLGRAQEAAGLRLAAVESYRRAVEQDNAYAAAHLRLGIALALEARGKEALAAFAEAERLYRASSNQEGEAEVLLARGLFYDSIVQPGPARKDLERAQILAAASESLSQQVRTQLALSSVTASEGKIEEAAKIAQAAVDRATTHGLETIAANGLIDLAALMQIDDPNLASSEIEQAIRLAQKRGGRRTEARARIQLASVRYEQRQYDESLAIIAAELPFLRENRYRRYELFALGIQARALLQLGRVEESRQQAASMLSTAESVQDENQIAIAAGNLAAAATALGVYPEALTLRQRVVEIRTRQGDQESLPYDLANHADVLIRLGRRTEAAAVLNTLDTGIASGAESFQRLQRRAAYLHALLLATSLECGGVPRYLAPFRDDRAATDSAGALTPAVAAFCEARQGRSSSVGDPPPGTDPSVARERRYWTAVAALEQGKFEVALREVDAGLAALGTLPNDELRWRLAAVGRAAALSGNEARRASEFETIARTALDRLRSGYWKTDTEGYLHRPDLEYLRKRAKL